MKLYFNAQPAVLSLALCALWEAVDCFQLNKIYSRSKGNISAPLRPNIFQLPPKKTLKLLMQTEDSQGTLRLNNKKNSALEEAEKLRQKAKELMKEANKAEVALRSSKQEADDTLNTKLDEIYHDLQIILNPVEEGQIDRSTDTELNIRLANVLREKRLSASTLERLVVRLFERSLRAETRLRNSSTIGNDAVSEFAFNIGDESNSMEFNESEMSLLRWWIDRIINAQEILDKDANKNAVAPVLQARIRGLKRAEDDRYQRELARKVNSEQAILDADSTLVNNFSQQTLGEENVTVIIDGKEISGPKVNITRLIEDISQVPNWVPSSILPFLVVSKKEIDASTFKKIRSEVLGSSSFNVEFCDYTRVAGIYRGTFVNNKRATLYGTNSIALSDKATADEIGDKGEEEQSALVFREIQNRLEQAGLSDEIQLFLMEDPEWRPGDREPEPLPSILAVSSSVIPEQGVERGAAKKFVTVCIALFYFSVHWNLPDNIFNISTGIGNCVNFNSKPYLWNRRVCSESELFRLCD